MALLRPHQLYGVTLCGKNNFGSVYFPNNGGWTPSPLHNYGGRSKAMNTYNCLVELNGHRHLGGKTLLYMVDGLYPAVHQSGNVVRWQTFGNDWCSSIFASQDPVAIDSVGTDFLRTEPACNTDVIGNPDNYLHEMAQANNPPSGTFYDPEHDGIRLASLGVHEHWNNPTDKKYSRNLGTGDGIELVTQLLICGDFDSDGNVDMNDFAVLANAWRSHKSDAEWNSVCDISIPSDNTIDMLDLAVFSDNWLWEEQ
jgi:hypothetical protein